MRGAVVNIVHKSNRRKGKELLTPSQFWSLNVMICNRETLVHQESNKIQVEWRLDATGKFNSFCTFLSFTHSDTSRCAWRTSWSCRRGVVLMMSHCVHEKLCSQEWMTLRCRRNVGCVLRRELLDLPLSSFVSCSCSCSCSPFTSLPLSARNLLQYPLTPNPSKSFSNMGGDPRSSGLNPSKFRYYPPTLLELQIVWIGTLWFKV